ncbi:hypothetical protein HY213_02090 [Candidatus Peregrinibacteria bacterium]|nr:hypothetical protein [Candidatus Peregrinibacteria bacterium]
MGIFHLFGSYRLNTKVDGISGLTEISVAEKEALHLNVEFKNELIYNAPSADFAGLNWEMMLGTVDGKIYKISALLSVRTPDDRNAIWDKVEAVLRMQLGMPASSRASMLIWDTDDGNIIVNRADAGGAYVVVITLTSHTVGEFSKSEPEKKTSGLPVFVSFVVTGIIISFLFGNGLYVNSIAIILGVTAMSFINWRGDLAAHRIKKAKEETAMKRTDGISKNSLD